MFLIFTIEVSSNDEVIVLEEAPPVQLHVRNECAPAEVWTAVALAFLIPLRFRIRDWFVPVRTSVCGKKNNHMLCISTTGCQGGMM